MKTRSAVLGASMLFLSLAACKSSPPPEAAIERRYSRSIEQVSRASAEAVQELGFVLEGDKHDMLGGQMTAHRATPEKEVVIIDYKRVDPRSSQVTVSVGSGERRMAELVQDHIASKLGESPMRGGLAAGATAEGLYEQPVGPCLTAAEQAMKDLKMNVTHREIHDTWAQIESREADSIPILMKMERTERDKTRVTIVAGMSKSQDTQMLADRIKNQFEQRMGQLPAK